MAIAQAKPYNTARLLTWGLFAVVLIVAPMIFTSPFSRSMLAQIGIAIVACLSYNVLLGQGGMLSFGHAVYTGLGTFVAVHVMNSIGGGLPIPISLIPLVGGLAGIFFAVILGYVTTKKAGTPFAMITLGIGELVASMALMFPGFFGGEGGITTDRVYGTPFFGITFGPAIDWMILEGSEKMILVITDCRLIGVSSCVSCCASLAPISHQDKRQEETP